MISTESFTPDHPAFVSFYDTYAPQLWGLILEANLPLPLSETILINTFIKAWHQHGPLILRENYLFTQLLRIAYEEGLPVECLQAILKLKL